MATYTVECVGSPVCPNHRCPMFDTGEGRMWQCSISGALFEMEAEKQSKTKDKFGNLMKAYKMKGEKDDD